MTPQIAASVLGLTGAEDAARIQSIYEAQAAALDSRIAQSEGEARARYEKDREEVELARLALLGSVVRPASPAPGTAGPAPAPLTAGRELLHEVLCGLLVVVLFAVPSAIAGYFRPGLHRTPAEMAATMAVIGPLWLLLGLAGVAVVHFPCKWLIGKSPGVFVLIAYAMGSWVFCRHGDPSQSTTDLFVELSATALGWTLVAVIVVAIALSVFGFLDDKSPAK